MEKRIFISCEDHEIPMVITYPETGNHFPCILMLHGFLAYKEGDGYLFQKFAQEFEKKGWASARIDFCSMGENRCSRKKYGMDMMKKETKAAFEFLQNDALIDSNKIGLLGHSLGGRVALSCTDLPSFCIITLNGAIHEDGKELADLLVPKRNKEGYCLMYPSDGRIELLFEDFVQQLKQSTLHSVFYENPVFVCIGKDDPTISNEVSLQFVKKHNNARLIEIEKANHTFNAKTKDYTKTYELFNHLFEQLKGIL